MTNWYLSVRFDTSKSAARLDAYQMTLRPTDEHPMPWHKMPRTGKTLKDWWHAAFVDRGPVIKMGVFESLEQSISEALEMIDAPCRIVFFTQNADQPIGIRLVEQHLYWNEVILGENISGTGTNYLPTIRPSIWPLREIEKVMTGMIKNGSWVVNHES